MKELIKAYKVLADESRLRVLHLLLERECCVCEVMQALEISQSKASRILNALYDVGFLKVRREGLWSLYSIDWHGMGAHFIEILEATQRAWAGNEQMAADRQRLKAAERLGPGCARKGGAGRLCARPAQPGTARSKGAM
jgi:ArsR family transcriptional regulator, arsenate/arsenite/antimonite-responsive transcriptional repressor